MRITNVLSCGSSALESLSVKLGETEPSGLRSLPMLPCAPRFPPAASAAELSKKLEYSANSRSYGGQSITPLVLTVGGVGLPASELSGMVSTKLVVLLSCKVASRNNCAPLADVRYRLRPMTELVATPGVAVVAGPSGTFVRLTF